MNFVEMKKYSLYKLNLLKEDLVQSISKPEDVLSYSGNIGSYIITPFGPNTYSVSITFKDEENFDNFVKNILKTPLSDMFEEDAMVDADPVINWFNIKAFINEAYFEEIQLELKKALNKPVISNEYDTSSDELRSGSK